MKLAIVALALVAAPAAWAQSSDWRQAGTYGTGDMRAHGTVDAASVKRPTSTTREVTVSTHFVEPRSFSDGQRYSAIRITYRIDCTSNRFQTIRSSAYDGETSILTSNTVTEMNAIPPLTIAAKTAAPACSGNFSGLPRITAATPDLEGKRFFAQ